MRESLFETLVGLIVVAVAGTFLFFSLQQRSEAAPQDSYTLKARFNRVDGIGVGSDVRLAGKKVGVVSAIDLDPQTYKAIVTFTLPNKVEFDGKQVDLRLPDDTTAQIASDGILGGGYLGLMIGGSYEYLEPGGTVEFTRGSVDLLTVLSEFASSATSSAEKKEEGGAGQNGGGDGFEEAPAP
jgi:phospholipid/cholesterol/gamma-HCH transport system substrate-binding protein